MKRSKTFFLAIGLSISGIIFTACSREDNPSQNQAKTQTYKVAVIMPGAQQARWDRVAKWAIENIDYAQSGLSQKVKLELEWKDESAYDVIDFMKAVASDESYVAIVGPYSSVNAIQAAEICKKHKKTLILPMATSTELQRKYANSGNVWNLVQSDITQCELMLTEAKLHEREEVSLLAPDNEYGRSFTDWFAFQAAELGLDVGDVVIYRSESELCETVRAQAEQKYLYGKALLFVPETEADAIVFDKEYGKLKGTNDFLDFPLLICSDMMCSSILATQLKNTSYEGFSPSAAPETGFDEAYNAKFGERPLAGDAHLFDAFLLLSYALTDVMVNSEHTLDESILHIVEGRTPWNGSWLKDEMAIAFTLLQKGESIDVGGVTGDWTFDARTHSSVLNTIYSHWILNDGKYTTMEYLSTDGGVRTTSSMQAWEWQQHNMQDFDRNQKDYKYPELLGHWAIVISTSDTWANYRHQADALAMYQLLKRHGYDDDHIILIMEDNIAYHSKNLHPGVMKVRPDGENLYHDVKVDYKLSGIDISDLKSIMMGERSDRLPEVITSGPGDNVVMFWCGHGDRGKLAWGEDKVINGFEISDILQAMNKSDKYRKVFFALDACYSGTIGEACEGLPGVIVFTAANSDEPSKADMKDLEMGIWLSNGFTRAFQENIDTNVDISLRDLYYSLARQTVGSHATVYNASHYGNVFTNSMNEFVK